MHTFNYGPGQQGRLRPTVYKSGRFKDSAQRRQGSDDADAASGGMTISGPPSEKMVEALINQNRLRKSFKFRVWPKAPESD